MNNLKNEEEIKELENILRDECGIELPDEFYYATALYLVEEAGYRRSPTSTEKPPSPLDPVTISIKTSPSTEKQWLSVEKAVKFYEEYQAPYVNEAIKKAQSVWAYLFFTQFCSKFTPRALSVERIEEIIAGLQAEFVRGLINCNVKHEIVVRNSAVISDFLATKNVAQILHDELKKGCELPKRKKIGDLSKTGKFFDDEWTQGYNACLDDLSKGEGK
jgi:hypothetical protein